MPRPTAPRAYIEAMRPAGRGFVLPTTLMVMTLLTVMLTAAFTMVSAEYRTTDNSFARSRAHSLAQAGLQTYFTMTRTLSGSYDSVRITMNRGYADVVARRLRDSTIGRSAMWLVRSSAYVTDPLQSGQIAGQRTVAQLAQLGGVNLPRQAAMFAINGVHVTGGTVAVNPLNGGDAACGGVTPRPALVTPTGRYTHVVDWRPSGWNNPGSLSAAQVYDSTHIDWPSIVAGNFTADYALPGMVDWNDTSIIFINGNANLSGLTPGMADPARGVLIVTGNLTIGGGLRWRGAVLVGGYLKSTGLSSIYGITVTGLNIALGQVVPPDTIGRNNGDLFYWSSCEYQWTLAGLNALAPVNNAWVDTWSTY